MIRLVLVSQKMRIQLSDKLPLFRIVHKVHMQPKTGQETVSLFRRKPVAKFKEIRCGGGCGGGGVRRHCAAAAAAAAASE
jgi:hypothetical protein